MELAFTAQLAFVRFGHNDQEAGPAVDQACDPLVDDYSGIL